MRTFYVCLPGAMLPGKLVGAVAVGAVVAVVGVSCTHEPEGKPTPLFRLLVATATCTWFRMIVAKLSLR